MNDAVVQCERLGWCYMYKADLEWGFCNLMDPRDYKHLGLFWDNQYLLDTEILFSLIFGSFFCPKATESIRYTMYCDRFPVLNYSDDIIGISSSLEEAEAGFRFLCALLQDLGLPASVTKLCPLPGA